MQEAKPWSMTQCETPFQSRKTTTIGSRVGQSLTFRAVRCLQPTIWVMTNLPIFSPLQMSANAILIIVLLSEHCSLAIVKLK